MLQPDICSFAIQYKNKFLPMIVIGLPTILNSGREIMLRRGVGRRYPKMWHISRLANLRVGQLLDIGNGAIFGSMTTNIRLVILGQKSHAFLTQMVQFWRGNCVSLTQNG